MLAQHDGSMKDTKEIRQKKQPREYLWNMWPIALAPSIPLAGLAFKKHPRVRIGVISCLGIGTLVYAHTAALSTSSKL